MLLLQAFIAYPCLLFCAAIQFHFLRPFRWWLRIDSPEAIPGPRRRLLPRFKEWSVVIVGHYAMIHSRPRTIAGVDWFSSICNSVTDWLNLLTAIVKHMYTVKLSKHKKLSKDIIDPKRTRQASRNVCQLRIYTFETVVTSFHSRVHFI